MESTAWQRRTLLVGTLVLLAGAAPAQQQPVPLGPVASPAPAATQQGITAEEIRAEMRPGHTIGPTVAGVFIGGFFGALVGGEIGYRIGYAGDQGRGGDSPGFGGAVAGVLIGGITGVIGGGKLGARAGEAAERDAAIRRIMARRAAAARAAP